MKRRHKSQLHHLGDIIIMVSVHHAHEWCLLLDVEVCNSGVRSDVESVEVCEDGWE